ncbi:MAG: nuclease-related domain-containing protein [Trueperaceae bacterium]
MATTKGTAGKTLIWKTIANLFFGSDKHFHTSAKGMEGERKVGKLLKQLPEGWRVWHDLDIGGENVDHIVASAKGVFILEAKNYSGSVLATPKGLYSHGSKTPSKIVAQVWRQTYKLNDLLGGQFVFPVLVFTGEVKGDKAKGIPCVMLESLLSYLRERENVLSYEDAKKSFATLDKLTK